MSESDTSKAWSGASYPTVLPAEQNSSVAHHAAVETVEDSAKIPGRIAYPLVVGGAAKQ